MKLNIFALFFVINFHSFAQDLEEANYYSETANNYYKESVWDSAEFFFRKSSITYNDLGYENESFQESIRILELYSTQNRLLEMKAGIDSLLNAFSSTDSAFSNNRAILYSKLGIYYERISLNNQALYYTELAVELLEDFEQSEPVDLDLPDLYLDLGLLHQRNRDYVQALKYYKNSLVLKKKYDVQPLGMADVHNSIAVANFYLGNYYEALSQYKICLKYYYQVFNPIHPKVAIVFNNMAFSHLRLQNYDSSLFYHRKALNIRLQTLPDNHPQTAGSYNGIGLLYSFSKDYDSAEHFLNKAIEKLSTHNSSNFDYFKSRTYYNLSRLYNDQNLYAKALTSLDKALQLNLPHGELQDSIYSKILNISDVLEFMQYKLANLAKIYKNEQSIDNLAKCLELFNQIQDLSNFYLNNIKFIDSQLSVINTLEKAYPIGISLVYDQYSRLRDVEAKEKLTEQMFQSIEYFKSNLLRRNIFKINQLNLSRLSNELLAQEEELRAEIAFLKSDERDSSELFFKEREYAKVIKEIETKDPQFHELKFKKFVPTLAEAIDYSKRTKKIIIEYFLSEDAIYSIFIENENVELNKSDIDSTFLKSVNMFYFMLSNVGNNTVDFDLISQIYQPLLKDYVQRLAGKDIVIIADGALHQIPFDLLTESNTGYLLERANISYSNSLALLIRSEEHEALREPRILAFAPEYDSELAQDQLVRSDKLVRLNWIDEEVDVIGELFEVAKFVGKNATEESFKKNIQGYNIVHFAGHGIVDDTDPMRSRLAFSSSSDSSNQPYLFTQELLGMDVSADLVVLSACKSGAGKIINGEGTLSLARGFFYAGSKSVVMSYWSIDDLSTSQIISFFYKNLKKGMSKSEALRQAKLEFLNTAPPEKQHPFYWGAFVVIGDDSPLFRRSHTIWVAPVVLLIFLTLLWFTGHLKEIKILHRVLPH